MAWSRSAWSKECFLESQNICVFSRLNLVLHVSRNSEVKQSVCSLLSIINCQSTINRFGHSQTTQNTGILSFCYWFLWRKITSCPPAAVRASSESHVCKQPIQFLPCRCAGSHVVQRGFPEYKDSCFCSWCQKLSGINPRCATNWIQALF